MKILDYELSMIILMCITQEIILKPQLFGKFSMKKPCSSTAIGESGVVCAFDGLPSTTSSTDKNMRLQNLDSIGISS